MSSAAESITMNTAFVFIKPHAYNSQVKAFVEETLKKFSITIVRDDVMSTAQIEDEGIIDRHYSVIARYAMTQSAADIELSTEGAKAFEAKFKVEWKDAVAKNLVLNAKQAAAALGLDGGALAKHWARYANRVKIAPGLYATEFTEEGIYVLNGFYLANREKFTEAGKHIHWFIVTWSESDLTWKDFRSQVIGATNPSDAPEGSLRRSILDQWRELGLAEAPNVSDNGVHASAGPLEALNERMVWLHATIRDDFFANSLLFNGCSASLLTSLLSNPVITLRSKKGLAFDLLEDLQSSEVVALLKELDEDSSRIPLRNHAFVFIKPHAVNHSTKSLVEATLALNNIRVDWEGEIKCEMIANRRIIDRHYSALSRYAMDWKPMQIQLDDAAQQMFENKFHVPWITAIKKKRVFNAVDAAFELGEVSARDLWLLWSAHEKRVKLAPGLYVTYFDEQDMYVVNGFYLFNREKFTTKGKTVHWFSVSWDETVLSWRDFRALVIGSTNPVDAPKDSIRGLILDKWKDLGLLEPPNTSDNGVHASASPVEAFVERNVWLNQRLENDVLCRIAVERGASNMYLVKWSSNPIITLEGRTGPVFDLVEDKDTSEIVRLLKRAEEEERNKVTSNIAFVFVKPHANVLAVTNLVTQVLKDRKITVLREGSINSEDILKNKLIDKHYSVIAKYAMELSADRIHLSKSVEEQFYNKYRVTWSDALHEGKIANAVEASMQLGRISPLELSQKWALCDKLKLGPGLYIGFLAQSNIFIINGFYLLNREKFTAPGKRIQWYVVSWDEKDMTWKDFRANVIGATDPEKAPEGSLRRTILDQWKDLGLREAPNVSDNGVHASAGPLEALNERMVWLNADLFEDSFSVKLLFAGVSVDFVKSSLGNPVVTLPNGGSTGPIFDLLEDVQSSHSLVVMTAMYQEMRRRLQRNRAFVFIKPHAVTGPVKTLVELALEKAKIVVESSGEITSERIYDEGLIDRHYAVISKYALEVFPNNLTISDESIVKFETLYGVAWNTSIAAGTIINASEAEARFGERGLAKRWAAANVKLKLAPGLYVASVPEDGCFVINGFYPANRSKFIAAGKRIHWYVVSWSESDLSWKDFRANIIGATDPSQAVTGSIRHEIMDKYHELELYEKPNVSDNGVHASAGPLEGLAERFVWLGIHPEADEWGQPLFMSGVSPQVVSLLLKNPVVSWRDKSGPAFDLLEDMQSSQAAAAIQDLQLYLQADHQLGEDITAAAGTAAEALANAVSPVSTMKVRNTAFVFVKPHAVTSGVLALLEIVLKDHRLRVEMEGEMTSDEIANRRIIDRHYATIYRYAEQWGAEKVKISEASKEQFKNTFHISWDSAVADKIVFNAMDAAKVLGLNAAELGKKWNAAPIKIKLAPGLYVGRFLDEDMYVMNGFYPANREKFTASGRRVHWYVVSWNEADLSWRDFRSKVVGPTDPANAAADSIRGTIYREWQSLGLAAQPDTADNGVHASAGPIEGFAERRIWLETKITDDLFGKLALQRGASTIVLQHWSTNPVVTLDGGKEGFVFDLFEDVDTTTAVNAVFAAEEKRKAQPAMNSAFVFVKPHALNRYVMGLVEAAFRENKIDIVSEGDIRCEEIKAKGLIDKHYNTIARYAMTMEPKNIIVGEAAQQQFRSKYGVSWNEAVDGNIVFNAANACEVLGGIDGLALNKKWGSYLNRVKLAPGLYVTEFTEEGIYVLNGFYLANREKFTEAGKRIHWYVVSWSESDLLWKDFRAKIIGATDPSQAHSASLRATILRQWEDIGLTTMPNVSDNGIHASAGPIEGLAERVVWLGTSVEEDPFGKALIANGGLPDLISDWITNNPSVIIPGTNCIGAATVFDQLEDLQSSQVIHYVREASKSYSSPKRNKSRNPNSSSSPQDDDGSDLHEISEGERLKATNCALLFVKPHACSKEVIALVDSFIAVNAMHVEKTGDIYSYDIDKKGLIDKHYATISKYAMDWKATTHKLSDEAKDLFAHTFGLSWDDAVKETKVLNAVDAAFSLGHLSAQQLARQWGLAAKRVKLAPGLYVGYFEDGDVYVINGFYLLNREKYVADGARIHYYVLSWKEESLSWKDFRAKIVGCTNPAEAPEGSIRRTIFSEWRNLGLQVAPNVSDNGVHASASPLEALYERMTWLGTPVEDDLFGRAVQLAGCSIPLVLEWSQNALVKIGETPGYAYDLVEDKQSSEVVNILSDATAELMFAPMKHITVTPKRKLFQASRRDLFLNAMTEDELRELFKLYDPEDTGFIDRASFKMEFDKMENYGQQMAPHATKHLFSKYDKKTQNGKMGFEEFVLVMMARHTM